MNPGEPSQPEVSGPARPVEMPALELPPGFVLVKTPHGRMAVVPESELVAGPMAEAVSTPAAAAADVPLSAALERSTDELSTASEAVHVAPILEHDDRFSARPPNRFMRAWRKIGGGSLTFSLLFHGGLILLAGAIVLVTQAVDRQVDFLPGGGTQQGAQASSEVAHKVQAKKQVRIKKSMPLARVVSMSADAAIALPELPPDLLDVPDVSSMLGGKMGSGGFGKGGAGGGFGDGLGKGAASGVVFKPIMMFGKLLKDTRKIAVVMDVSRSMTRYLPLVTKELDKYAHGSPLVLYFGCGLMPPKEREKIEDKVFKARGPEFDRFWQLWQGRTPLNTPADQRKLLQYDPAIPMPLKPIYDLMSNRPNTYFIDFNGITYAWTALMCEEVMEADTLYWFSDFQDRVSTEQMEIVVRKLKFRKQKIYIHASTRGRSFQQVVDGVVTPLKGEVIEAKAE